MATLTITKSNTIKFMEIKGMKNKRVRQLKYKCITKCFKGDITKSWWGMGILHLLHVNLASWHRILPALSDLHHFSRELTQPVVLPSANSAVQILLKLWNRIGLIKLVNMFTCSLEYFWEFCLSRQGLFLSQGLKVYPRILFLHPGVC